MSAATHTIANDTKLDCSFSVRASREQHLALLNAIMLAHQRFHHQKGAGVAFDMPVNSLARGLLSLDSGADKFQLIGIALDYSARARVIPAAIYNDMPQMRAALTSDNVNQICCLQVRRSHFEGDRSIGRICGRRIEPEDVYDGSPGQDVDLTPFLGTSLDNTPLHFAAACSSAELVKLLLDHGANTNARNTSGQTPIEVAELRGAHAEHSRWAPFPGIVELLRRDSTVGS